MCVISQASDQRQTVSDSVLGESNLHANFGLFDVSVPLTPVLFKGQLYLLLLLSAKIL